MTRAFSVKAIVSIMLFCMATLSVFSQRTKVSLPLPFSIRQDDFAIVGKVFGYYAIYYCERDQPQLLLLNGDMKLQKSIPLPVGERELNHVQFSSSNDGVVATYETRKNGVYYLYATALNKDLVWNTPVIVDSCAEEAYTNDFQYVFAASTNGKYHLAYTYYLQNSEWILRSVVFNNALEIIKTTNQIITEREIYLSPVAAISNDGMPFFLATDKPSNKGAVSELYIVAINSTDSKWVAHKVSLERHTVTNLQLIYDDLHHNLYTAGFYSEGRYSTTKGLFHTVFDAKQLITTSTHFTHVHSSDADLRDMELKKVSLRSDGGIEMTSEKVYQSIRTINNTPPIMATGFVSVGESVRSIHEFNYDELAIFNIKNDGKLSWSQLVLKEQMTSDDGGILSSFGTLEYKLGKAYYFSDLSSNVLRLMVAYVSASGDVNMKELQLPSDLNDWSAMPRSSLQVGKAELLIPVINKNQICFIKLYY